MTGASVVGYTLIITVSFLHPTVLPISQSLADRQLTMAEETEDVKPKIDLTINYEGQSQHSRLVPLVWYTLWNRTLIRSNERYFLSQRARLK